MLVLVDPLGRNRAVNNGLCLQVVMNWSCLQAYYAIRLLVLLKLSRLVEALVGEVSTVVKERMKQNCLPLMFPSSMEFLGVLMAL